MKKSNWSKKLEKTISEWQFATCPTEEKEPFFWRWTEYGREQLASYIHQLLQDQKEELREKIIDMIEEMEAKGYEAKTILEGIKLNLKFNKFEEK